MKNRPEVIHGKTIKFKTNCGNMYVTLNTIDKVLGEIRIQLGKAGTCQYLLLKSLGIYMSLAFQNDTTWVRFGINCMANTVN